MRVVRYGWSLVAAGLLLAACAGDGDVTPVQSGESMAALAVIDTRTDHRPVTAEAFTEAAHGQRLDEGDTVRTDDSGFAEVVYADGSLTRLDAATVFTIVALGGDVTVPEIEVELEVGRVWNRVNTVTGERGRFEVETAVGTAAVRGTAFAIACTDEPVCTFTVAEGLVVVTTLDGAEIEIAAGEVVTLGRQDAEGGGGDGGASGTDATGGDPSDGGASDGGASDGGASDGGASDATTGDGTTSDGDGGDGAGTSDGDTATSGTSGGPRGDRFRTVVLDRTTVAVAGVDEVAGAWLDRNEPLDADTGRFGEAQQRCSVTVAGRNVDHATTPETAIEADIDRPLLVDAVATGELERYVVDLHLGGLSLRAAEGEVLPDESGDRTGFRGEIDVSEYAEWGVGLYEVAATTTGTACEVHAFVNVTGRHPLTTVAGVAALLLAIGGAAGLAGAVTLALDGGTTATTGTPDGGDPTQLLTDTTVAGTSSGGTTQHAESDLEFIDERATASSDESWLTRLTRSITELFRSG